jgi:uncharacterized protein (DUF1330 family)
MDDASDEELVAHLIGLHGEEGICPSAADWRAILAVPGAIHVLNLLAFVDDVPTPTGVRSGEDAYRRYTMSVAGPFARAGGERVFFGAVGHVFTFGAVDAWDTAILTRYPSALALAGMWLDPEFVQAHQHRVDGVTRSLVMIFGA